MMASIADSEVGTPGRLRMRPSAAHEFLLKMTARQVRKSRVDAGIHGRVV